MTACDLVVRIVGGLHGPHPPGHLEERRVELHEGLFDRRIVPVTRIARRRRRQRRRAVCALNIFLLFE